MKKNRKSTSDNSFLCFLILIDLDFTLYVIKYFFDAFSEAAVDVAALIN